MSPRRRPRRRAPQTSWVASANGVGLARGNRPTRYAASPTSSAGERPASRSSPSAVAPSALLSFVPSGRRTREWWAKAGGTGRPSSARSEEHTSELQSRLHLVCRLLLEKKKKKKEKK